MEYHFKGEIRIMDKEEKQAWRTIVAVLQETGYDKLYDEEVHIVAECLRRCEQQCKKQQEVIDKINLIIKGVACGGSEDYYMEKFSKINELIKEVQEWT